MKQLSNINILAAYIDDLRLMISIRQTDSAGRQKILRRNTPERVMLISSLYWAHDTADLYDRLRFYETNALQLIQLTEVNEILTNS